MARRARTVPAPCQRSEVDRRVPGQLLRTAEQEHLPAPNWPKWRPCDPTCAHWYADDRFARLISAYIAHDADRGRDRLVRELVAEFSGLSATAKQKAVLA